LKQFFIAAAVLLPFGAHGEVDWRDPQSVVRAGEAVSPALAVVKSQIAAAEQRVALAFSLPNPMVMAGVQNQPVDWSIDRQMTMYMIGASQTLTRKSRREAQRSEAEFEVVRLRSEYESQKAEIEREILFAYYDAAAAQSETEATSSVAALTSGATSASRARYEAGTAPQSDIIRSLLEQKSIAHQLLSLESRRRQATAKLAALLHVSAEQIPKFALEHEHASAALDASLNPQSPALAALRAEVEAAEQELRLAELARKPDINIEASYGFRPYERDMISVVGRVELPYRRKQLIEPAVREAMARRDAAKQQIDLLRQRLQQDLGVAAALRDEAVSQLTLHENELVPAAKMAFESSLASYQSGRATFESVLESLRAYTALRIDAFEFLTQKLRAEADLEALRNGARAGTASGAAGSEMR